MTEEQLAVTTPDEITQDAKMLNIGNIENIKNIKNIKNINNENIKDIKNINNENIENIKNIKNIKNINNENIKNIRNINNENIKNIRNVNEVNYITENLHSQVVNHSSSAGTPISSININQKRDENFGNIDKPTDFIIDEDNNIILIGKVVNSEGTDIAFISKIDQFGELLWNKTIDGVSEGIQIAIDLSDKNSFVFVGSVNEGTSFTPSSTAINRTINGWIDIVVIKFNMNGEIIWSTFWGGALIDSASGVVIDNKQNIIITGTTYSTNFPVTGDAVDKTKDGTNKEFFITKFTKDGEVVFSTYYGGSTGVWNGGDRDPNIVVDKENDIIMVASATADFITSAGAFQTDNAGNDDIVILKLDAIGQLVFATYFGGSLSETATSVSLDNDNNIYFTGQTLSPDFPTKNAVFDKSQGRQDFFIVKFDKSGNLTMSTYYGFEKNDVAISIQITSNNDILLTGRTDSNNLPTTTKSYQMNLSDGNDAFIIILDSDYQLKWMTYLGGLAEDSGYVIKEDKLGDIIVVGSTASTDFPLINSYEYTFGGIDGFISKFMTTGEEIWVSRTIIVTEPGLDLDEDTLSNSVEFRLKTNPLDADTDKDGMNDGWEVANGLLPLIQDQNEDPDQDGFTNRQESQLLTDPFNSDTDGDFMDDRWEFLNQLDPLDPSDFNNDMDKDGMHALWEYKNNLNPLFNDGDLDFDNDGLTNFEEWNYTRTYSFGLDPNNKDTDADGMDDGWEVKNRLDPLNSVDVRFDPDNDFLNNGVEYKYRRFGLDPNRKSDLYVLLIILIINLLAIISTLLYLRKIRNLAISYGFSGYIQQMMARRKGFLSSDSQFKALERGFLNKEILDVVMATGYENTDELFTNFRVETEQVEVLLSSPRLASFKTEILSATSPNHVSELQDLYSDVIEKLNNYQHQLTASIALQDTLIKIYERSGKTLLVDYSQEDIDKQRNITFHLLLEIEKQLNSIHRLIQEKMEFFIPWNSLLQLIKVTEEKVPLTIREIMEVINRSEEHCEKLLILLLKENRLIGNYDIEKKIYVKETRFDEYIDDLLEFIMQQEKDGE